MASHVESRAWSIAPGNSWRGRIRRRSCIFAGAYSGLQLLCALSRARRVGAAGCAPASSLASHLRRRSLPAACSQVWGNIPQEGAIMRTRGSVIFVVLVWACAAWGAEEDVRKPVPSEAAQEKSLKSVKRLFKDDYSKTSSTEKQQLAKKLLRSPRRVNRPRPSRSPGSPSRPPRARTDPRPCRSRYGRERAAPPCPSGLSPARRG